MLFLISCFCVTHDLFRFSEWPNYNCYSSLELPRTFFKGWHFNGIQKEKNVYIGIFFQAFSPDFAINFSYTLMNAHQISEYKISSFILLDLPFEFTIIHKKNSPVAQPFGKLWAVEKRVLRKNPSHMKAGGNIPTDFNGNRMTSLEWKCFGNFTFSEF